MAPAWRSPISGGSPATGVTTRQAAALYAEGLTLHWDDGDSGRIAAASTDWVSSPRWLGQAERAARLCGAAEALREAIGAPVPRYRGQYERAIALARATLGEQAFAAAWAAGRALSLARRGQPRRGPSLADAVHRADSGPATLAEHHGITRESWRCCGCCAKA